MKNWKRKILSDVCKLSSDRININKLSVKNYISTENLLQNKGGKVDASALPSAGQVVAFSPKMTLVSNIRPYFRKIYFSDSYGGCSNDVLAFIAKEGVSEKWLYYLLSQDAFFDYVMSGAKGTKMPRGDKTQIMNFPLYLPPFPEQVKMAHILDAIDEKISASNKINQNLDWEYYFSICRKIIELEEENQNLEAQAQAIFKSWFVDFEPFGGKMPADWNIAELRAVCKTITKGTTPTTLKKAFVDKGVNFIKAESILSNHTIDLSKIMFIDDETNELLSRSQIKPFDILYTIAGTIGRFSMVMPTQIPANTNQAVAIIRCIDEYKFFIYNMFLCGCHTKYLTTKVVQAVQANLSLAAIGSLPIIQPSQDTLEKYLKLITPIFSAIFKNNEESRRLSQLRDTLLPKLMSGEIDVSDVAV